MPMSKKLSARYVMQQGIKPKRPLLTPLQRTTLRFVDLFDGIEPTDCFGWVNVGPYHRKEWVRRYILPTSLE